MSTDPSVALCAQAPSRPAPRTRARARHILDNYYIGPAKDASVLEIWGYTDRFSYHHGDSVGLRVSTTADRWDLEIARDGADYEVVLTEAGLAGKHCRTPGDCSVAGCGWPVAYEFTVPSDWRPGAYLVTMRAERRDDKVEEHHLIVVRPARGTRTESIVLFCATGTWVAYNCWGGSNAYEGITGPDGNRFSPVLSTERPWTRGFCKLPEGAPRPLPETDPRPGEMIRYPYMEWAYSYGYSKKYASAGWASYERHFARWAENEGFRFDIATLHDLDAEPDLLDSYRCAIFVGHDEYWSRAMRDAIDAWIEAGGRAARFAGNFLWQVRIEGAGRLQICHKYFATTDDPVMGTPDQHLLTGAWEAPEIGFPGAGTFGVNGLEGVYAGLGNCVGSGPGGFTIYRPEHWAFDGTCIGYGDVLGSASRIFGYEVDGLDHEVRDGLPYPTGKGGASEDIVILGVGLATHSEADHGVWGETLYIGGSGAAWKAHSLYGEVTPQTLDRSVRGNGMIVSWMRGKGEVFAAGTCEWVMGLKRGDMQVEQVTRNVLSRFCE